MPDLPDPTPASVAIWLKNGLDRRLLHEKGWQEANHRFHGITRAVRPFIQTHFKTPEEQAAAFDGLTLALLTLSHFEDIKRLENSLASAAGPQALLGQTNRTKTPQA